MPESVKFIPEMYLKQSGVTHSACGPFTKPKVGIQKVKGTRDLLSKQAR